MFELSYVLSTVILSILSLTNIVLLTLPNISKLKNFHWFLIKVVVIMVITFWIIILPEEIQESYFFIGGSFGLGFLIRGVLTNKRSKYMFHIFAYSAFSIIFLAVNQTLLFIINLSLSYVLHLGLLFYSLNIRHSEDTEVSDSKGSKFIINTIVFLAFASLFGFLVFSMMDAGKVDVANIPFNGLFALHSDYRTILIVIILTMIFTFILMLVDLYTQIKRRNAEQWYT